MTAQTILPANTLSGGYEVANSCRFNSGSSDNLTLSTTAGNRTTWTFSTWFKRSKLGVLQSILEHDDANYFRIRITSGDVFEVFDSNGNNTWNWHGVLRDTSSWYHIVLRGDSTDGTNGNRLRLYINGSLASANTVASIAEDYTFTFNQGGTLQIGKRGSTDYLDGYLAETILIDGQALAPDQFGEFDEDSPTIWKPIDVSGLTFGTQGFYLDFEDSSALGADVSGNTNNFTVNNLTAVDQSTDTCTNNFATLNPLNNFYAQATLSNGNLDITTNNSNECFNTSTLGASSGKWYMEVKIVTTTASIRFYSGVTYRDPDATSDWLGNNFYSWGYRSQDGKLYNEASLLYTGATLADGDIVGIAMDLDNHKLYTHKAGTYNNSGDPTSGATGTGAAALDSGETYFFAVGDTGAVAAGSVNFGSPSFAISSGNADANGHGNFEYAVPSGYYSLNTKNLAEYG